MTARPDRTRRRGLLALGLLPYLATAALAAEEDREALAAQLPRIPPRSPEEALGCFRLREGFRIELVAAEPLVVDPVAMAIDPDGRMFVVEMRDYPFTSDPDNLTTSPRARAQPPGRVRLLEDADGDGRAERSRVFADDLAWPTGIALHAGGVLVASAPDILELRDEDGDGTADRRRVVWTGFSRRNVQALLNSFRWGLDSWLYCASGGSEARVRRPGEPPSSGLELRGQDFRFRPGGPMEAVTGGGQFGLSFGEWGERFLCSNSNHLRHVVLESRLLERNPWLPLAAGVADIAEDGAAAPVFRASPPEPWRVVRTRWRAAAPDAARKYIPTELVPTGFFTSASGVTIYRGHAFPEEFRGNAFVGDVGGNLVHRKALFPRGATFTARRPPGEETSEFLTSSDNWFRPVSLSEGPDGCLYVLDMYRETIEHPHSIPDSLQVHLDLTSGNDRGRIWRIVPRGFSRPPAPALSRAPSAALVPLLAHPGGWWRETAQRLLVERQDFSTLDALRDQARRSASPLGRTHSLWTLAGLGTIEREDLAAALADPEPRVREQAVRLSGERPADAAALEPAIAALAADADARVRLAAAFVLGGTAGEPALRALERLGRQEGSDRWMRAALLAAEPGKALPLLRALLEHGSPAPPTSLARSLAEVVGARGRAGEPGEVLAAAMALPPGARGLLRASLMGLGEGLRRGGGSLERLLEGAGPVPTAARERLLALFEEESARARKPDLAEEERLGAVRLLAHAPFTCAAQALEPLIDAAEPPAIQAGAAQALAARPGPAPGPVLAVAWARASPAARPEVEEGLFREPSRIPALLDALASGSIPPASLDPARRRLLLEHRDPSLAARAAEILSSQAGGEDRRAVVERAGAALALAGSPARGREAFRRLCATCHRLDGEGHEVGPDLRTSAHRSPEALLVHVLDPNRELLPAYATHLVITQDGRALTGIIAGETRSALTLRRAQAVEETVLRSSIRQVLNTGLSLMPEGLERDLDPQTLADLIAYLLSPR